MAIDSLLRLKQTLLFKSLLIKEKEENGDNILSSKVVSIVSVVAPLLDRIPENMPEYTLHDPNHSAKVVENMGKIIPEDTLNNLNSLELTLLILSGYLHDIGMTCSKDEKEQIISLSDEFEILFKSDLAKYENFKSYKAIGDHRTSTFIEDQVFTEYLRRNHVLRSANYIKENLSSGELNLTFQEIPFWKHLIAICNGHGEPVSSLYNTSIWPRHTLIADRIINIQYSSLILRLADILDLDPERTPKVIYEYVNPKDPVSIIEWKKHRSLIGYSIRNDKVLFEAECSSPEVQRALEEFMDWIEIERQETISLLKSYTDEISKQYHLTLNEPIVKDRIRSDGSYISNDLKFQIDYKRVMELLMGQKLYKNPIVAIRELLQNSIDAIKIRKSLYTNRTESFIPTIKITLDEESLSITDNGIGMDINIFKNYFLQVGKSFYSSPTFYGKFSEVDVSSEFGIGILSTFMVANSLVVESRREPDNPLHPSDPILFEIPTAFSFTTQRVSGRTEIGTTITLKLKSNSPFKNKSIESILKQIIPKPPYTIEIQELKVNSLYKGINENEIAKMEFSDIKELDSIELYKVKEFKLISNSYTHKILDINIKENNHSDSQLNDIEGTLSIVNTSIMNYYSQFNGYLSQRSFNIGVPEIGDNGDVFAIAASKTLKNLFPDWMSYYSNLNFTKSACLSLTPDRTDFIVDEKYKNIKKQIELKIISELKIHFENIITQSSETEFFKYADLLIATGFLGLDLHQDGSFFSKEAKQFLSEYLSFPVLNFNGTIERKRVSDIALNPTIGILNHNWKDEYIKQTLEIVEPQKITLLVLPKMEFGIGNHLIERFISALLGNQDKLLNIHTVLITCMPSFEIKLFKVNNEFNSNKHYNDIKSISNTILNKENQLLLMPRQSIELYPILNTSHSLIAPLFNDKGDYKTIEAMELKISLSSSIREKLHSSVHKIAKSNTSFSIKALSYGLGSWDYTNYYALTSGILKNDLELFTALKEIFVKYWNDLKDLKLIDLKANMPKITTNDFLAYWNE